MENEEDVNEFFSIIENDKMDERLWLPYHIVEEFVSKKEKEYENIDTFENDLKKFGGYLKKILEFSEEKYDRSIQIENYDIDQLKKFRKEIKGYGLDKLKNSIDSIIKNKSYLKDKDNINNTVFDKLGNLFDNKVGENFNVYQLNKIFSEGELRNKYKIPPAFRDSKKPYNKFGDLIIWKQIIKYAKDNKKNVIFVSNDNKDDWKLKCNTGEKVPHYKLINEFRRETGKWIHIVNYTQFLEIADSILEITTNKDINYSLDSNEEMIEDNDILINKHYTPNIVNERYYENRKDISLIIDKLNKLKFILLKYDDYNQSKRIFEESIIDEKYIFEILRELLYLKVLINQDYITVYTSSLYHIKELLEENIFSKNAIEIINKLKEFLELI